MNSNEFEGAARDLKGKVKDGYGGLTGDIGTQAEGKLDQAAGKLQAKFGDTVDEARSTASDLADHAADAASTVGAKLRDVASSARNEAIHAGETVYAAGTKAAEAVSGTVRQQPFLALLGMGAIGYLVSFLVHSPSSPLAPKPQVTYLPRKVARYLR
jgi:uncharacterized protein YjbJ (UPF0337 family)